MRLSDLDDARCARFLASTTRLSVVRNAAVYRDGDPSDRVFVVDHGRVKIVRTHVSGAETIVGIRTPGDIFGELGAIEPGRLRTTSAVAIEPSRVHAIAATTMRELLATDIGFARAYTAGTARRLTEAEYELTELAGKSVPGRLVDALGRLATMYGEENGDGTLKIGINLTHRDLADLIGTSRETLTKELGVLADVGLVRVTHKTVTLVQPQAFPIRRRRESN
jgi:CRP/FNR family cyclic AMP-dependent transcriptional regulator